MADFEIIRMTEAEWTASNPTLLSNQLGVISDIRNNVETAETKAKLGNSIDKWSSLSYWQPTLLTSLLATTIDNSDTTHAPDGNAVFDALALKLDSLKILRSYLAATITYNNTTTLADTALSVPVEAGGIYDIELTVHSTNVTRSLNMDFGGTATIANFIGQWWGANTIDFNLTTGLRVTAAGTDFTNASLDSTNGYYTFKGSVEITNAGTFLLRGAQNALSATDTTILRGSDMILVKTN